MLPNLPRCQRCCWFQDRSLCLLFRTLQIHIPITATRGNLVVGAGTRSREELIRSAPKVLEILQFSYLNGDPFSGTFSSEIRLARLHDNVKGTVSYLKGGSLSGSVADNFRRVKLSKELGRRSYFSAEMTEGHGYQGPAYGLLSDVSVVG